MKKSQIVIGVLLGASWGAWAASEKPGTELLLSGGTLYSMTERSYRSLHLPDGWKVMAGAYSPEDRQLAFVVTASSLPAKSKIDAKPVEGPVTQTVRQWPASSRLLLIDRHTGLVNRSWRLPSSDFSEGSVSWTSISRVTVTAPDPKASGTQASLSFEFDTVSGVAVKAHAAKVPAAPSAETNDCPRTLAETLLQEKKVRFVREGAACSSSPEKSDFYRLVRQNEKNPQDAILWEYRVAVDTATCTEHYTCYTGTDVQFLSAGQSTFLVWDGDLYAVNPTADDGVEIKLLTQLLPQVSHPWGIAPNETHLNNLDVSNKVTFQPVDSALSIPHGANPVLYAQNFSPTRSFSASIEVGPYSKNVLTPAGYQVGPIDIGSFQDRAYTPLLISATWVSFHHLSDPVRCQEPYTIAPHTKGIQVSLTERTDGTLQCAIRTQEDF